MPETGRVKFFDIREGNLFGFLRVLGTNGKETGEEIFFHYNDREVPIDGEGEVVFCQEFSLGILIRWEKMPYPKRRQVIIFEREKGSGGRPKACPWTYEVDWANALLDAKTAAERNAAAIEMRRDLAVPGRDRRFPAVQQPEDFDTLEHARQS